MEALAIFLFAVYLLFLVLLYVGWRMSFVRQKTSGLPKQLVTVVVAARNEGQNISMLLNDLRQQSYDTFEVIIVDDHSTDNTWSEVEKFADKDLRFKIFHSTGQGKKQALSYAIQRSFGEIIVATDADCRVQPQWLAQMVCCLQSPDTVMAIGAVRLHSNSYFGILQAHEFLSLTATSASTLSFGIPSMCNGANLAFWKKAFDAVEGYNESYQVASGDDQVLMFRLHKKFGNQIRFVSHSSAVVTTQSCTTLKEFTHQRIRWAGKWRHNQSIPVAVLAVFIFCVHLMIITLPFSLTSGWIGPYLAIGLITGKIVIEWLLLSSAARFVGVKWNVSAFLILQVIYPVYAICIGVASLFMPFEWKGRRVKTVSATA